MEGKDAAILILAIIGVTASLEATDVTNFIAERGAAYCDNSRRGVDEPKDGGGTAISGTTTTEYVTEAGERIPNQSFKMRHSYILSKTALETIFNYNIEANGIAIMPYFDDKDSINLMVAGVRTTHTLTEGTFDHSYIVKTFCPYECDEAMVGFVGPGGGL